MKPETNPYKRAWIWFWYNDATRIILVIGGGLALFVFLVAAALGVKRDLALDLSMFVYFGCFCWALADNDYTNLYRIGLDVNRRPLPKLKRELQEPKKEQE
jgi:hypothetical protein